MEIDLDACIRGGSDAWNAFVDRYAPVIYAAVQRVARPGAGARDRSEIHDIVQEVFVRLVRDDYRLLRTFDPTRASLVTWLSLVSRSVAIDQLRRRRPTMAPLPPEPLQPEERARVPGPGLPLHLLTSRQRLVLRLLFDDDLTVEEAARFMGVDTQTVRSTKHKALSRLREHFAEAEPE